MGESMFDPYKDKIRKWCESGVTINEQVALLGEGYNRNSLYAYIHSRNLWDDPYGTIYAHRNHCDECDHCHKFKDIMGNYTKSCRICDLSWRVINKDVKCRPTWCEKERKDDYSKTI